MLNNTGLLQSDLQHARLACSATKRAGRSDTKPGRQNQTSLLWTYKYEAVRWADLAYPSQLSYYHLEPVAMNTGRMHFGESNVHHLTFTSACLPG